MDRAEQAVRKFSLTFDGTVEDHPWGHRAIKVKGKMFAILARDDAKRLHVTVKLPFSNAAALSLPFAVPTGYGLGKSGWVKATFAPGDAVPVDLLSSWVEESYQAVAAKEAGRKVSNSRPTSQKKTRRTP